MRALSCLLALFVHLAAPAAAQEGGSRLDAPLPADQVRTQRARSRVEASPHTVREAGEGEATETGSTGPSRASRRTGIVLTSAGLALVVVGPVAATRRAKNLLDEPEVLTYRRRVPVGESSICRPARDGEHFGVLPHVLQRVVDVCNKVDTLERLRWSLLGVGAAIATVGLVLVLRRHGDSNPDTTAVWIRPGLGLDGGAIQLGGSF